MIDLIEKWFPKRPEVAQAGARLERFYRDREDYHLMTAEPEKERHGNVRLLEALIEPGKHYLEVGSGSGRACSVVAGLANVVGLEFSEIAIQHARSREKSSKAEYVQGSAMALPFAGSEFDGVYCFEVLEHLWDPLSAVIEMIRVVKPGGFILLSAPNRFSLDLHLNKHYLPRSADYTCAAARYLVDVLAKRPYVLFEPNIEGPVYPDCDAVSTLVPRFFLRELSAAGARTVFWDSSYLCAEKMQALDSLRFQRRMSRGLRKHFGDHFIILLKKAC